MQSSLGLYWQKDDIELYSLRDVNRDKKDFNKLQKMACSKKDIDSVIIDSKVSTIIIIAEYIWYIYHYYQVFT